MVSKVRNLVEYTGLMDDSGYLRNTECFKKFVVREKAVLQGRKPEIDKLVKAAVGSNLIEVRLVKTERALALDGQSLTGKKAVVDGEINIRLEYVDNTEQEEVHSAYFSFPFSSSVALPENTVSLSINSFTLQIPDCSVEIINSKTVVINFVVLILADC